MSAEPIDPQNATRPGFSRRGFVALGSGAAFAFANAAAAGAQSADYGKPHAPIVAEDDPAISVVPAVPLAPTAGTPITGYAAMPKTVTPSTGGIVVTQAIWGVDAQLRDVVRRLAKAGFVTVAPRLFERVGAPDGDNATDYTPFAAAAQKMTAQGFVATDLLAGHDWIRTQARDASIGITGFCMGGGIALQQVIDAKAYAALAMFYGDVRPGSKRSDPTTATTFDYVKRISTPVLGSFGGRDASIKPEDVMAFRSALTAAGVPNDIKIYDEAGHAFEDDTRSSYVATAATDAWSRTLVWFRRYLG